MELPEYFSPRPPAELKPEMLAEFEQLYSRDIENGNGAEVKYDLDAPKWLFLSYLADTKDILLHGSGNPDIEEFEPRQSNDTHEFGNRKAVYAASDALWAMYFAIVDRERYVTSLVNACFRVVEKDGTRSEPYYYFSINDDAMPHSPWRTGMIYILPRDNFEHQPVREYGGRDLEVAQWASLVEVKPLAKITVEPGDFPFLSQIRFHNLAVVQDRAARNPEGFPWLAD